jgi:hypothetical protein
MACFNPALYSAGVRAVEFFDVDPAILNRVKSVRVL